MWFAWSRGVGHRACYRRWRSRLAQSLRGEGYWRDCRERRKTVSMVCMWRSRIKKHKNLQTASPCRSRLSHIWAIRGHFWWQIKCFPPTISHRLVRVLASRYYLDAAVGR